MTVLSNEYVMLERNGDRIILLGAEDSNGYADQKTVQELADQVRQEQGRSMRFSSATGTTIMNNTPRPGGPHPGRPRPRGPHPPARHRRAGGPQAGFFPVYCGIVRSVLWTDGGLPGGWEISSLLSAAEPRDVPLVVLG